MATLIWDEIGDRRYERGVDKGVLYLPSGSAVPWNGLISVIESFDRETSPVYYDGMKINELVALGDFSGTLKAITYPDEFEELEGLRPIAQGVFIGDQRPQTFGLCYRTKIGNDLDPDAGYKIHIIYNVIAIPNQKDFSTITDDFSLTEFEWRIFAVPEEVPGYRATAHFIINSLEVDPEFLIEVEAKLYGSSTTTASLVPMPELIDYFTNWYLLLITDNGDGTITIESQREGYINFLPDDLVELLNINATYLNPTTVEIYDVVTSEDVFIIIIDHGDGTWTATTQNQDAITIDPVTGEFQILNANANFVNVDTYEISDSEE